MHHGRSRPVGRRVDDGTTGGGFRGGRRYGTQMIVLAATRAYSSTTLLPGMRLGPATRKICCSD